MTRLLLAASLTLALTLTLSASDWPHWMGPNRDDVWPEAGVFREFPKGGPDVKWRVPVKGGYSGPAVVAGRVYLTDRAPKPGKMDPDDPFKGGLAAVPSVERVLCFNAADGKELWKHEYDVSYQIQYPVGPRCTPTVGGGKVYTLGAMGDLFCLTADGGKVIWSKNFPKDYAVKTPQWGFSGHPVLYKNLLICLVGGEGSTVVAFDKDTGKEAWKALTDSEPGYNTPALIETAGTTQLVVWTPKRLHALNPLTGTEFWQVPLEPQYAMSIMSPRKHGELLFVGGIGNVGVVLRLDPADPKKVTEVWRAKGGPKAETGVFPVNMTPVIEDGVIYGADQPGAFRAVRLATGERLWSTYRPVFGEEKDDTFRNGSSGTAFVTKNGDRYFLFNEVGELIIAKLSPKGYEEVSKAKVLEPTTTGLGKRVVVWSHPAYAEKCAFLRNDKELICVSLAAK